ncbi:hypothetical protein TNCV_1517851 [Trichonephila clavipes]|nr:hypothetical protein TNCV_1517851 [Trichonephila clavipes]
MLRPKPEARPVSEPKGSSHLPITNVQENKHIVRSTVQNRTTTTRTLSQEMYPSIRSFVFSSLEFQHDCHYFGFPWQCSIEGDCDSGAPNDKTGNMSGIILCFQTSPVAEVWFQL